MIQISGASLSFGNQKVFDNISCTINEHDKIGLIGRNGSGKTTLLKAIIDSSFLDSGSISSQKNKKIAYMPQEVTLLSDRTILEETISGNHELYAIQNAVRSLESHIEQNPNEALLEEYAHLQERLNQLDPERYAAKTKQLLIGLGFTQAQLNASVSTLSVGWKMRIVLAKLLLQEADFYLFDEPTNHLDLKAKEWFLHFLKRSSFGFMLICHEKYFLDELCEKILDIDRGHITWYTGNYSASLTQKEQRRALLEAAYTQQQKEIEQKKATIARFKASASKAKMAQSMQKALDKIDIIEIPPDQKKVQFHFPALQQSGKEVITLSDVSHAFGDKQIFKNVSCMVPRGAKIAIVASNGVGKTTLLNLIAGALQLQHGTIRFGHNVQCAVFAQDQNKVLTLGKTIIENIHTICPKATEQIIRSFLGAFLFSGEDVLKKVKVLSGGEKNRVGMVGVLLQHANLLLLDEPTNHLDIQTKEILLDALKEYAGTILFVSHDRDFVNDLATDILELTPSGAYLYKGNYDSYVYQTSSNAPTAPAQNTQTVMNSLHTSSQKPTNREAQKQLATLEKKIAKLDQSITKQNSLFLTLSYGTPEYTKAVAHLENLQKELAEQESLWEQLVDHL